MYLKFPVFNQKPVLGFETVPFNLDSNRSELFDPKPQIIPKKGSCSKTKEEARTIVDEEKEQPEEELEDFEEMSEIGSEVEEEEEEEEEEVDVAADKDEERKWR
jgi:hypothetical protein